MSIIINILINRFLDFHDYPFMFPAKSCVRNDTTRVKCQRTQRPVHSRAKSILHGAVMLHIRSIWYTVVRNLRNRSTHTSFAI